MERTIRQLIRNILSENFVPEGTERFIQQYADGHARGNISKAAWGKMSSEEQDQVRQSYVNYDQKVKEVESRGDKIVLDIIKKGAHSKFGLTQKRQNSHLFDYVIEKLAGIIQEKGTGENGDPTFTIDGESVSITDEVLNRIIDGLEYAFTIVTPNDYLTFAGTPPLAKYELDRDKQVDFINKTRVYGHKKKGFGKGMRRMNANILAYQMSPSSSFSAIMSRALSMGATSFYSINKNLGSKSADDTLGGDQKATKADMATTGFEFETERDVNQEVDNYLSKFALTALKTFKKLVDDANFSALKTEILLQRVLENKTAIEITSEAIESIKAGTPTEIAKLISNKIQNKIARGATESFDELLSSSDIANDIQIAIKDTFNNFFKTQNLKGALKGVLESYNLPSEVTNVVLEFFVIWLAAGAQSKPKFKRKTASDALSLIIEPIAPLNLKDAFIEGSQINDAMGQGGITSLTPEQKRILNVYKEFAPKGPNKRIQIENSADLKAYPKQKKRYDEMNPEKRQEINNYLRDFIDSPYSEIVSDNYLKELVNQVVQSHKSGEQFEIPAVSSATDTPVEEPIATPEPVSQKPVTDTSWEDQLKDLGDPDELIGTSGVPVEDEIENEFINEEGDFSSPGDEVDSILGQIADNSLSILSRNLQEQKLVKGILKLIQEKIR